MHARSYLQNAASILALYQVKQPFSLWLKQYFRQHKKFGSKDRKLIGHLCYCYFRIGCAFSDLEGEQRIITALFLCSEEKNELLQALEPALNEQAALDVPAKFSYLGRREEGANIFRWNDALSPEIDRSLFNQSFLMQPGVYIRIRPGRGRQVQTSLQEKGIPFHTVNDHCIAVAQHTPVDQLLQLDKDAVVQDLNSQRVFDILAASAVPAGAAVWDCCAASGGKTILFHDLYPYRQLTVSDVRENILHNLQARLQRAGIKGYRHFVADIARPDFRLQEKFDLVICDAPCSGSGTWSRTPEQLQQFDAAQIHQYASLQKKIVRNAARALNKNGGLLYITCSVFAEENESVAAFIRKELSLQLQASAYFKGYNKKADTLFAAFFTL